MACSPRGSQDTHRRVSSQTGHAQTGGSSQRLGEAEGAAPLFEVRAGRLEAPKRTTIEDATSPSFLHGRARIN